MTADAVCIGIAPDGVLQALERDAMTELSRTGGELILDFSAVPRIEPAAARALERLAERADQASVKVTLRAVRIDIYKVLKLLKLAQRFTFLQ